MKPIITIRLKAPTVLFTLLVFLFFPPLTHAKGGPPQKIHPIFSETFDSFDSIKANGGTYSDVTLAKGKSGSGVLIQGRGKLVYPAANHINFQKGTIEFWIKPNWDSSLDLGKTKFFLTVCEGKDFWTAPHRLIIPIVAYTAKLNQRIQNIFAPAFGYRGHKDLWLQSAEPFTIMKWQPGQWHKITLFWDFTLPDNDDGTHNSYMVAKIDDTYTPCKKVAPVGADGFAPDAKIILGQDHVLGRFPAEAVIDELKIYDRSLLPVVPFPEYQFNPANPATVATFRKLFKNDGFCSNFETYNTDPADCPKLSDAIKAGQNVLFFQRPPLEQVFENYVPQEAEINNQFNYQAPPGEFETLFFNVYSRIDLNHVRVTYTDFHGAQGTIPRADLDLRVVKNWFQAGRGPSTVAAPLPVCVPELLLHNDQIPLDTDQTLSQFKVPSLPFLDHVQTKISKFTSKQFAMIVKVPEGTPAGIYSSTITLSAAGIPKQTITLNLEVLPFALRDTGKIYSLAYGCDMDAIYAKKMGLDVFAILKKDLTDIKNHDFNALLLFDGNDGPAYHNYGSLPFLEVEKRKIKAAAQAGLKRIFIYAGLRPATMSEEITPQLRDLMLGYGFEPWFYGVDEPGNYKSPWGKHIKTTIEEHIDKSQLIHRLGGKVITSTDKGTADGLANPHDKVYAAFPPGTYEPLDGAIYIICDDKYFTDLMAGRVTKNPKRFESYYWQNRDENPQTNRYYCGYFLWNTGLDGAAPTFYKAYSYNEFNWPDPKKRFRDYGMAYASVQGPVPTLQGEATREGIKDGKYLATWKFYRDKAALTNPALAHQSDQIINNILKHYIDTAPTANPAAYRNSMAQYETDRKTLINEIINLINRTR
jgi:hypothetical protein